MKPGSVFWVNDHPDPNGNNPKDRPVVVIRKKNEHGVFIGIYCSHSRAMNDPIDDWHIQIPHDPENWCITKLKKATVACCDWYGRFTDEDVDVDMGGKIDQLLLTKIAEKTLEIANHKRSLKV